MKKRGIWSDFFHFISSSAAVLSGGRGNGEADGADSIATAGAGRITIDGVAAGDPAESIYVRRAGHGAKTIVLIPGNNTSGMVFEPMLNHFRSIAALAEAYTVYTFDYRGSGRSSYNKKISALKDFALDFEKVMSKITDFPNSGVTIVGYSMGFGVAQEMVIANPGRYSDIVSLAGIGTRGVRVGFAAAQAGTDSAGQVWSEGDWVTVTNDTNGVTATGFHQRSWQGENRTYANVEFTWDLIVFQDILQYDIAAFNVKAPAFKSSQNYKNALLDVLTIQYMPESLYYSHKFNVAQADCSHTNADGAIVTIKGDGRLSTIFTGKNVMLVKATADLAAWRGDQVIHDNYTATTKYDLREAGAKVNAVMIGANQGYDHGFPISHPLETIRLIDTFLKGTLCAATAATALEGAAINYYPDSEKIWETNIFTGF